jgi:hypothetical protein
MKKIVAGFLILLSSLTVYAQAAFQREWAYGLNGGMNFSSVSFTPKIPQETLRQVSGGAIVRYVTESNFGLQVELNYSLRGWKEVVNDVHTNYHTQSLSYLELPMMTHIYAKLGKKIRWVFNLGPQLSYNIGYKVLDSNIEMQVLETQAGENTRKAYPPYHYDPKVERPFDYGLTGGTGLELRTGIGHFIVEGRYYFGLSDMFNNTRQDYFQASHNQVIGVKVCYLIPFTPHRKK